MQFADQVQSENGSKLLNKQLLLAEHHDQQIDLLSKNLASKPELFGINQLFFAEQLSPRICLDMRLGVIEETDFQQQQEGVGNFL